MPGHLYLDSSKLPSKAIRFVLMGLLFLARPAASIDVSTTVCIWVHGGDDGVVYSSPFSGNSRVRAADLCQRISASRIADKSRRPRVVIVAPKAHDPPLSEVVSILAACRKVGFRDVTIVVRSPGAEDIIVDTIVLGPSARDLKLHQSERGLRVP